MEQIKSNTPNMVDPGLTQENGHPRKNRGAMHILKAAISVIRRRSVKRKTFAVDIGSSSVWRRLVGSVRPLHLQSNLSPPRTLESRLSAVAEPTMSENVNEAALSSGFDSPVEGGEYESQSPSREPESRYSSGLALNELVDEISEEFKHQEEPIVQECEDDVMNNIDAKAEEFIAQFYEEMRLQRLHFVEMDHSHNMTPTT